MPVNSVGPSGDTSALWTPAGSAVLIPYNAPSAASSNEFQQVLSSISTPPTNTLPGSTAQPWPASQPTAGPSGATPMSGTMPPSTTAPAPFSAAVHGPGCCCCCGQGASACGGLAVGAGMPQSTMAMLSPQAAAASSPIASSGATPAVALRLPFQGTAAVTQGFGPTSYEAEPSYNGYAHFHTGIDYDLPLDTPVISAGAGQVVAAGWDTTGFGNRVVIDHGNGILSLYGHLDRVEVTPGQWVSAGQQIGLSGSTGNSSGPHLHFGVEHNGQWVDPSAYLAAGQTPGMSTSMLASASGVALPAPMARLAGAAPPAAIGGGTGLVPAGVVGTSTGVASGQGLSGLIRQVASQTDVSGALLAAVVQAESGGNPQAVSPAGAKGLMQLMPATASAYGVSNVFDPVQNLMAGASYLHSLLQQFHGDEQLAIAAYNAGPGAVVQYGGIPPYAETEQYVQRVTALEHE